MTNEKTVPVTTLKLLGNKPAEFDLPVKLSPLGGNPIKFAMRVKALRKTEWAELRDERQRAMLESIKSHEQAEASEGVSPIDAAIAAIDQRGFAAKSRETAARDADLIMKFSISWPGEEPLNENTLVTLEDECGGALEAIVTAYDAALFAGRLGN